VVQPFGEEQSFRKKAVCPWELVRRNEVDDLNVKNKSEK
jgi:hypothetical protein